jgi:mono/diheme cytochrome c family protein
MPVPGERPGRPPAAGSIGSDGLFQSLRNGGGPHDFHLDDAEALALTLFLGSDSEARGAVQVRDLHEGVDSMAGRRIFVALNCAGCHPFEGIDGRPTAPLLSYEGARVREEWLRRFLLDPGAIRPYGPGAGPGGRMPDFGLSEQDADSLVVWLMGGTTTLAEFAPDRLSAFDREKAAALYEGRFSCSGCHAVNGRGGRIGPDLGVAAARLEPSWIRAMLDTPGDLVPGTIMPPARAPAATLDLLAAWLTSNDEPAVRDTIRSGYLSLIENPPPASVPTGPADYIRFCAACHGETGSGDGYNARFLRVRPADHTDRSAMAVRPDDVLYDAIAAGGRYLDRSPEMPGFGGVLDASSIGGLVAHIRTLCSCEGDAWSRDGTGR